MGTDGHQLETERIVIALGGNEGDVARTFQRAIRDLEESDDIEVTGVSSFHTFPAVGKAAGNSFLNAALTLSTALEPQALLDFLQVVESQHGRVRTVHWGPRTLDLDLILFGERIINSDRLTVPHPACWYRRFVLDPAVEVAADALHPIFQLSLAELRNRLLQRPLPVGVEGPGEESVVSLCETLSGEFPEAAFTPNPRTGRLDFALYFRLAEGVEAANAGNVTDTPLVDLRGHDDVLMSIRDVLAAALASPQNG